MRKIKFLQNFFGWVLIIVPSVFGLLILGNLLGREGVIIALKTIGVISIILVPVITGIILLSD